MDSSLFDVVVSRVYRLHLVKFGTNNGEKFWRKLAKLNHCRFSVWKFFNNCWKYFITKTIIMMLVWFSFLIWIKCFDLIFLHLVEELKLRINNIKKCMNLILKLLRGFRKMGWIYFNRISKKFIKKILFF
jgi:hypothetical protein